MFAVPPERLIDTLAEAQRYSLDITDPWVRAETIDDALFIADDEIAAWVYEHAQDAATEFEVACADGDYTAACEIAETDLLPTLHDAVAAGRFERLSTPDEMRARDPHAFRVVTAFSRDETRDWLAGPVRAQPTGAALVADRPRVRAGHLTRARCSRRGRVLARSSSCGDRGDGDGDGGGDGGDEPPPPAPPLAHTSTFRKLTGRLARLLRRRS